MGDVKNRFSFWSRLPPMSQEPTNMNWAILMVNFDKGIDTANNINPKK
jgi:hypothetical protein